MIPQKRKSGFGKLASQIRASELGFPHDPAQGPRSTSMVKLKKDEETGESVVDESTKADIQQAAAESAAEIGKAVKEMTTTIDRKTINQLRKSQFQTQPEGFKLDFDMRNGGGAAGIAPSGPDGAVPPGYATGQDDFGKLHCHFGFFHLFLGLGDAVVASTILVLLCVSALLFLQRRLVKESSANKRRNMRKLLRGNELAYYFEKLGIQKSGHRQDMHMLNDDEAARNLSRDAEHQLQIAECDLLMTADTINLEDFGVYDVAYHDKSDYRNPYKNLNKPSYAYGNNMGFGIGKKQEALVDESVFEEPIPEMDNDAKRMLVKDRASYHYMYA